MRKITGTARIRILLVLLLLALPIPLNAEPPTGRASGAGPAFEKSYMYAVNLSSTLEPVEWERLPDTLPFDKYLLYETRYRTPKKLWHRLRMGFFPTKEAAAEAMAPLLERFPGAWVTRVSTSERRAAEGLAHFRAGPPEAMPPEPAAAEPTPPEAEPSIMPALILDEAALAMRAGEFDKAAGLYKEVLKAPGDEYDAAATEGLARAYELGGDLEQARAEYKTYLLLYPGGQGATRVRARLEALKPPSPPPPAVPAPEPTPPPEARAEEAAGPEAAVQRPAMRMAGEEEEPRKWSRSPKTGLFVSLGATRVEIGGNFDGKWSLVGAGSTDVLPNLETATGFRLGAGYRFEIGSIELGYAQSDHIGTYAGADHPSRFKSYSADAKLFVTRGLFDVRPFVSLGAGYITLDIQDGSTDGVNTSDTKLKGRDLRAGAGVEVGLARHLAVDIQGIYRWGSYRSVEGLESGDINGHIDGNGATFSISAKYIL